jgi:putative ABC transport system permease protein
MKLLSRLRYLLRQRQMERDLAEEIEHHRHMSGNDDAMGNMTRAREDARAVWIWPWLQSVWQDLAYAVRNLRRAPGFTLVAVLTLGTAIGLNTSFFTVFNGMALRPWPVKDPEQIVKVFSVNPRRPNASGGGMGVAEYRFFAENSHSFSGFAVTLWQSVRFGFEPFGKSSQAALVGGNHFRVLGIQMLLGRGFLPEEDRLEAPEAVAVLSYPYWRDHFGSDPAIVGKQVPLNEVPFTIVGVTPQDFAGTADGGGREDVYLPLQALQLLQPAETWIRDVLAGRLAPGISRPQAAAELEVLDRQFRSKFHLEGNRVFALTGTALMADPNRKAKGTPIVALLFVGVTLVVLLACANVGNLLIARAGARQKEIEIRRAIGAGRGRIIRQLMTESLLLALGAVAVGLPIAYWLPMFVINQTGEVLSLRLTPDGTVLAYAIALAVFACIGFGLAPALHGTRQNSRSRLPLRNLLLAVQVALSVVLLIGAGLALQGIARLRQQDPGFAIDGISVVSFELPAADYDAAHAGDFYRRLLQSLEGGQPFGISLREPLSISRWMSDFRLPGQPEGATHGVLTHAVTPGYFEVLRMPLIAGRNFAPGDDENGPILVNQALARQYWNNDSPVGKTTVSVGGRTREIVGVVRDAYTENLDQVEPTIYTAFPGTSIPKILATPAAAPAVAAIARRIEPRARTQVLPLQANVDRWFAVARIGAEIAGMLGVFALILATVGMSGVFAYVVQQRTKEIGIRMALGARPAQVVRLVLRGSSRAVVIGLGIGLALALLGSRLMLNLLYGVSPLNPVAYLSVACILAAAGIAASYVPARRASRVDPLQALRHD